MRRLRESQRLAQLILEQEFSYATTQIDLPEPQSSFLVKWGRLNVQNHQLHYFEDGGGGRETEPHITVLYGLLAKAPSEALRGIVRRTTPFTIRMGPITLFKNDDFDVVKFSVISKDLEQLSNAIRQACPNENKYPKYIPHATVAYVKPGTCDHLNGVIPWEGDPPVPNEFEANTLLFKGAGDEDDPERKIERLAFNIYRKESLNTDDPFQGVGFPVDASELTAKILGLKKQPPRQSV